MIISDSLYGDFKIEQVLEDLINSKPVQRLRGVHQGGASYLVNPKWNLTRYEHSVGVMLLIRTLGGSLEEQIAGLLHDISHTAFSHVVDFALNHEAEDYHEQIYYQVVVQSDIPGILTRHGYNFHDILKVDKWTILEQDAPELCADRVDYTLRDMYHYGHISKVEVDDFLQKVITVNGKMYLEDVSSAEWFVQTYYKEVIDFFLDPLNIYGYDVLAKLLKLALESKLLESKDLLGTDEELISLLKNSENPLIQKGLKALHSNVNVIEDKESYDIHLKKKLRLIDPSVFYDKQLIRASELSKRIRVMSEDAYAKAQEGTYVKII